MDGRRWQRQIERLSIRERRIGVTGFARSGKTVFIAAAAQALLTAHAWQERRGQGPLAGFAAFECRRLRSARIRHDLYPTLPQFPFHAVRDSLVGKSAHWPVPTEGISRLVLELDFAPQALVKRWLDKQHLGRTWLRLEIVDYPGEWLIDLPMLEQSYAQWSRGMWQLATQPAREALSAEYRRRASELSAREGFDEEDVAALATSWAQYLRAAAEAGLTLNQPGRALRPDSLRGSPVLRFAPLPEESAPAPLVARMRERFEGYKRDVIRPFFRESFARIDRQIVLVDTVRVVEQGAPVFDEMVAALRETLRSFNYSKGGPLARLMGARTSKVLFAATKADHVVRADRANLENLLRGMLALVDESLPGKAARVGVMALASVRATEDYLTAQPPQRQILYGKPAGAAAPGQWDPGGLPLDIPPDWERVFFRYLRFEPPLIAHALQEGFSTINLGKALNFLIGEDAP